MKITILKRKRIQLVTSTDASNHSLHPAAAGFVYRRSNIEFVNENIVNNPEVYRTQWTFEVEASLTVTINQEPYEQLFCVLDFQTLV